MLDGVATLLVGLLGIRGWFKGKREKKITVILKYNLLVTEIAKKNISTAQKVKEIALLIFYMILK